MKKLNLDVHWASRYKKGKGIITNEKQRSFKNFNSLNKILKSLNQKMFFYC